MKKDDVMTDGRNIPDSAVADAAKAQIAAELGCV